MTTAAGRRAGDVVVLTKPGTEASIVSGGIILIFGAAVAAHATDRVEAGAAGRKARPHGGTSGVADVAGIAIKTHHGLMDAVEGALPVQITAGRVVVRVQETSVTSITVVARVRLIGLSCSRPDHGKTEQRHEKYQ
jgi:hypothetical protein